MFEYAVVEQQQFGVHLISLKFSMIPRVFSLAVLIGMLVF